MVVERAGLFEIGTGVSGGSQTPASTTSPPVGDSRTHSMSKTPPSYTDSSGPSTCAYHWMCRVGKRSRMRDEVDRGHAGRRSTLSVGG